MKRVPVIMQMEAVECGAASLSMVLASYGRWESLEDMRVACGVSRDGCSAGDIMKAARHFGMEANGYRLEMDDLRNRLEEEDLPCILHVDCAHFVVLVGVNRRKCFGNGGSFGKLGNGGSFGKSGNGGSFGKCGNGGFFGKCGNGGRNGGSGTRFVINDPAAGRVYMSEEELSRRWTGVCLTFKPSEGFKRSGVPVSPTAYIARRLTGVRQALLFNVVTSLLLAVVSMALPVISQMFADGVLTGVNPEWGTPIVMTMAVLTLFQFVVNAVFALYGNRLEAAMAISATSQFVWHLLFLPMRFFYMRMPGDLVQRVLQSTTIPRTLVKKIAPTIVNGMMLIIYALFMVGYSVWLTVIVIVATTLTAYSAWWLSRWQMNVSRRAMRENGKLYNTTMSGIENIETIKAAGAERGFFQKWANAYTVATNMGIEISRIAAWVGLIPQFLMTLASCTVLVFGCSLILEGQLTIGMLMAFQGFMQCFFLPMNNIVDAVNSLISMRAEMERVEDVYRAKGDKCKVQSAKCKVDATYCIKQGPDVGKLMGDVELRDVTFGYSTMQQPLVEGFSFHLRQGQSIAFVGASGCGKTTIANLVSGLYRPWSGEILYDGRPIEEINRDTFTSSVSIISQASAFFEGTISDNIKLWDGSIEDFAMILACRDARIHDDIARRDGAYQAEMRNGGRNFSGGQRQRLEIAAALVKEPTILIMDEATSALDAKTEAEVMRHIRDLGLTLIIIAHRLSTIRDCDEIVVLDHGRILERGNHDELVKKKGRYYNLLRD